VRGWGGAGGGGEGADRPVPEGGGGDGPVPEGGGGMDLEHARVAVTDIEIFGLFAVRVVEFGDGLVRRRPERPHSSPAPLERGGEGGTEGEWGRGACDCGGQVRGKERGVVGPRFGCGREGRGGR
jgi:hypothetical protein